MLLPRTLIPSEEFLHDVSAAFCSSFARLHPVCQTPYYLHGTEKYLTFMAKRMRLTAYEFIYGIFIYDAFVQKEEARIKSGRRPTVQETNFATILICGMVIGSKIYRDNPYSNKCWSTELRLHLSVINSNEPVLLAAIDYRVQIKETDIEDLRQKFGLKI